jgi:hypothetical protein
MFFPSIRGLSYQHKMMSKSILTSFHYVKTRIKSPVFLLIKFRRSWVKYYVFIYFFWFDSHLFSLREINNYILQKKLINENLTWFFLDDIFRIEAQQAS